MPPLKPPATEAASARAQRGLQAEQRALELLQYAGLKLVTRNFRCRGGELDLVMAKGNSLIVVEVRQRSRRDYGGAAASVTTKKRQRIIHATRNFLARHPHFARHNIRFDVIAFEADAPPQWLRAAFDTSS